MFRNGNDSEIRSICGLGHSLQWINFVAIHVKNMNAVTCASASADQLHMTGMHSGFGV